MGEQRMTGPPMPDKTTKAVVSSGGVVFNDAMQALIIKRRTERNWVLPKGKKEEGESLRENALREVSEETGLMEIEIDRAIGLVRYTFFWFPDDVNYLKTVHYFLMRFHGEREPVLENDFSEYKWVTNDEAIRLLKHKNDRLIARKGFEMVEEQLLA